MAPLGAGAMPEDDDAAIMILLLRGVANEERRRAERAAALAADYEARALSGPEYLRELRTRMAKLHRRIERRHRTSAGLQDMHATTTESWLARDRGQSRSTVTPFRLMDTVADAIGVRSATAALHGNRHTSVVASSSDSLARAAHELEQAVGEGPARSAAAGGEQVLAAGRELPARWSLFGPAALELGVRSVLAVPLQEDTVCMGTLSVYGTGPALDDGVALATRQMAGAVTRAMLITGGPLFDDADYEPAVYQAAGMMAARSGCDVNDAEDLLRARAFAEGRPVAEVAQAVLRGEVRL